MPWKASRPMDVKLEFVTRLLRGERMTDLCTEYGINRQTGYEVAERYKRRGAEGLEPQSRAPKRSPHRMSPEVAELVMAERRAHPTWGPKKIKAVLERGGEVSLPAASSIGAVLQRGGLIQPRRRRHRFRGKGTGLHEANAPNEVWAADYKGQFRLGDRSYCYPFTMTDQYARYVLACDGMAAIDEEAACEASENAFRKYGLPAVIRTDNGCPFASTGLAGLSRLSAFWLRLGIELERITPGHPEQNGRHERMHRTLKQDTARPGAANLLAQQQRFSAWVEEFNTRRPHEAIAQQCPADVYRASERPFPTVLPQPTYPLHDDVIELNSGGRLTFGHGDWYHLSAALAHQPVGIREEADDRWLVTFMAVDLGHIDRSERTFRPL